MAKALFQLLSRKNSLISDWSVLNKRLQLESEITIKLKQEIKDNKTKLSHLQKLNNHLLFSDIVH